MVKHVERRNLGIDAKFLREIAEDAADFILLAKNVNAVEIDRTGVRLLERGDGAHQRTLSGAVRSNEAEHAVADGERKILERLHSIGVGLRETGDGESHLLPPSLEKSFGLDARNPVRHTAGDGWNCTISGKFGEFQDVLTRPAVT